MAKDFEKAKAEQAEIEAEVNACSDALQIFPRGKMGMVSDEVRESQEYRAARVAYDRAFERLRKFNAVFIPSFKKELQEERAARNAARLAKK